MLKFDQLPPTAAGTELDPGVVRTLAYEVEDRCINNVAEVCASIVVANSVDVAEIKAIGEKCGHTIAKSQNTQKTMENVLSIDLTR